MPPSLARSLGRCAADGPASSSSLRLAASSRRCRLCLSLPPPPPAAATAGFHTTALARAPPAAAAAAAAALASGRLSLPADYVPPTQPPSAKRPDIRKAQLLRAYTSLLRTTPLMLLFQHNNLTGPEWTALRRELGLALRAAAEQQKQLGIAWPDTFADSIRIQVVRTRMFDVALRVTEFFDPAAVPPPPSAGSAAAAAAVKPVYTHDLSATAYAAIKAAAAEGRTDPAQSVYGQLAPLLVGPLAVLTFPDVSPAHLAAALSVLAPSPPAFPAPTRRKNPGYHEPAVQSAVQKLLLVGGRVEGKAFDGDGVRWVGSLQGGRAGLQAQLVALLQSAGLGLTSALEGAGKSLWLTMESRRTQLEDGEKEA